MGGVVTEECPSLPLWFLVTVGGVVLAMTIGWLLTILRLSRAERDLGFKLEVSETKRRQAARAQELAEDERDIALMNLDRLRKAQQRPEPFPKPWENR